MEHATCIQNFATASLTPVVVTRFEQPTPTLPSVSEEVGSFCKATLLVLSRFSSGLFRALFSMKEIWNGKEIHRRVLP